MKMTNALPENPADMPYNVTIEPDDFVSSNITGNLYWPLATGKVLTYEGEDEDGDSYSCSHRVDYRNQNY